MSVDYNNFAKTFSKSREKMKWEEIEYFLSSNEFDWKKILDIWCWNWRLLKNIEENNIKISSYLWLDLSNWLLEEAKKNHPNSNFLELNMLDLDKLEEKFDIIFFIASFHHLQKLDDRLEVLKKVRNLLWENWKIFLTNWNLIWQEKYKNSEINWSENEFWSIDFNIKIWEFYRFYHSFSINELEYLFKKTWFDIIENRIFENWKNLISIIK